MKEIDNWTGEIHEGDAVEVLTRMPENSVNMCMTSPPYWNLRDYDHDDQLGLEPDSDEYVSNIADVMDEVERVLRPDGSLWLNLGDTYENKNLQQIPARVSLELQRRGWILRNRVTWEKPNPMPESVKDRLNTTTEAVFHLTPEPDYWYDLDAIREPHAESPKRPISQNDGNPVNNPNPQGQPDSEQNLNPENLTHPAGKNPGDVFEVATKPFSDAHFAVYPSKLCEKPIKASCPPQVCVGCGAPYEREKEEPDREYERGNEEWRDGANLGNPQRDHDGNWNYEAEFHGWTPTCECDTDTTEPGICLDPFAGAGTTCMVADELGRRWTGIDINPEYVDIADERMGVTKSEHKSATDW